MNRDTTSSETATTILTPAELASHLEAVGAIIPPLWPLADYVAVNPFLGLADRPFLVARQLLADVRVCDILPTAEWFRQRLSTGAITAADLDTALAECREEHPEWFASLTVEACRALLDDEPAAFGATPPFVLPADPFAEGGKPLAMKRSDAGLSVYSIGPDGGDDGGPPPWRDAAPEGNDDVGFVMTTP